MSNNILITGCKGQLGSEFKNIESNYPELNFYFRDRDLDISIKKTLEDFIIKEKINIILNTAAYTDVISAEVEREKVDLEFIFQQIMYTIVLIKFPLKKTLKQIRLIIMGNPKEMVKFL